MSEQEYVYDEEIARRYERSVPLQDGEVEFYLELARAAEANGLPTLELGAGNGRIAVPLARAGVRITGLDMSEPMLAIAREKSSDLDNVRWLHGDMRQFDLGEAFGLIYIAIGTFQLMLDVEDQLACLLCVRKHLAPAGRFAFEVENPNIVAMAEWLTTRRGQLEHVPDRDYTEPGADLDVIAWNQVEYHPAEQRYARTRLREEIDSSRTVVRREFGRPMMVRYFHRFEMEHLLARAGFTVEAMYGDLRKNPYGGTSPDMIWVARASS